MVEYVKGNATDTWHWCKNCSQYPKTIYTRQTTRPSYDLCNQCKSKEKEKNCRT